MIYHIISFICGYILDLIFGDPYSLPHPVRWIGNMISKIEKKHLSNEKLTAKERRRKGRLLVFVVCVITELFVVALLIGGYIINSYIGVVIETVMTYQILATKSLKVESMKVHYALEHKSIDEARVAVSMIVGRDTKNLDESQIAKAAVETVAENTSDGIIAPMIYLAIGGPILGFLYKAINTMDSMVGYKNDKYIDYGRMAAKLDDVVNYIPARISAVLMVLSCTFLGKDFDVKNAWRIYKRDRFNHASPNSAQTEAAMAGALGLQLAGNASYFGKIVKKPYIGDKKREIENKDIIRANKLLYMTSFICETLIVIVMGTLLFL